MTQTTILLMTLAAMAGLPAGYWLAWLCDPDQICRSMLRALMGLWALDRAIGLYLHGFYSEMYEGQMLDSEGRL